jgi:hypothetical protein
MHFPAVINRTQSCFGEPEVSWGVFGHPLMFPLVPSPLGLKKSQKIFPSGIFHPLGMLDVCTLFGPLVEILPLPFPESAFDP